MNSIMNKIYFKYIVIYHDDNIADAQDYTPIIKVDRNTYNGYSTMHLLDKNITTILPAIEFILHLPQTCFQLYELNVYILANHYDVPHDVLWLPDYVFEYPIVQSSLRKCHLIIYNDDCNQETKDLISNMNPIFGSLASSTLNNKTLNQIIDDMKSYALQIIPQNRVLDLKTFYMLKNDQLLILPAILWPWQQYSDLSDLYYKIFNSNSINNFAIQIVLQLCILKSSIELLYSKFEKEKMSDEEMEDNFKRCMKEVQQHPFLEVIITFPGIPKIQRDRFRLVNYIPIDEKRAIRVLGLHRAIAKGGILIELPIVPDELFTLLNKLELSIKQGTNNKFVWKTMRKLGKIFDGLLLESQKDILHKAKHITLFSNFPINYIILPGFSNSFSSYTQVSYNSLTPLGRALQYELEKKPQICYSKKFKILFAECVPKNKENRLVYYFSEECYNQLHTLDNNTEGFSVTYEYIRSISELKKFISKNIDADCLYISAHGAYDPKRNITGLYIGEEKEPWFVSENDFHVPPFVVLSACHLAPRGFGCISVADLFMRAGAIAVLASCIPVNALKNTVIMSRLFVYISEAMNGSKQYKTLLEAWTGVTSTAAINEIMASSKKLKSWIMGKNRQGEVRLLDFMLKRCKNRLRISHSYEDTISILREMLEEEGLKGKFEDIFANENYFPESFFYQFIGYPENIFLYSEVYDKYYDKYLSDGEK